MRETEKKTEPERLIDRPNKRERDLARTRKKERKRENVR